MEYKSALVLTGVLSLTSMAQSQQIDSCLEIISDQQRLACYDQAHGYTDKTTFERPISISNSGKAKTEAGDLSRQSGPLPSGAASNRAALVEAQQAYDSVLADAVTMTVTEVRETKSRQRYFFTDNGRTFKRITSRDISFRVFDSVKIEGGVLGSMFLINQDDLKIKVKELK